MPVKNNPLKWHGGKSYLAPWIISHFPPHTHYVEPYFGGGAVLLAKPQEWIEGHSEAVNDINGELINFWNVLRCPTELELLKRFIEATPFCESIFDTQCGINKKHELALPNTPVERAWRFFVLNRQSRQGLMKDFATMSRTRTRRGMNEQVSSWLTAIEGLPETHERLKRVVIFNKTAVEIISQEDSEETFFYLDPPYLHGTRTTKKEYGANEMSDDDHARLLAELLTSRGKFILSGYPSEMYNKAAQIGDWRRVEKKIDNKASAKKIKDTKTECLWLNF
jgi:DNA adenine methylase